MARSTDPTLGPAIVREANRLGIDPVDLATAIGYETVGTYSTDIRGGAGNNYYGLIQFGPAERRHYGIVPGMTADEQMAKVGDYLQDRGLKPGSGLLDIYSTINAGSPGHYGRADASGKTVRQHVAEMKRSYGAVAQGLVGGEDLAAATLPTYPTGEAIAPGYVIPAAGPFIEDAGAATNTLTGGAAPTFPDMGAGTFAGGYGNYTPPAPPTFLDMGAGTFAGGYGNVPSVGPTGFGNVAPSGSLSDFVANGPMTAHPPIGMSSSAGAFGGAPMQDTAPLQAHITPASSYVPPTPVPIQPYTTQAPALYSGAPAAAVAAAPPVSPAAGAAAASGLQDYQLPMGSSDPNDVWANQMPDVATPPATIAPAAPAAAGLGSLINHAIQTVSHVIKTGALPNGTPLPSLAQMSGITGFGGGPLPAGVSDKSGIASFLSGQSWHSPSLYTSGGGINPSGGSSYTYFSPSAPGGIGGYVSHNGTLFTYPTDPDIYHSVAS